uniref:Uncharacterized protein n=1 Tax=Cacopsylla melanoneura TaxID=428564 RepID=A0A8D8RSB5_9HEMI
MFYIRPKTQVTYGIPQYGQNRRHYQHPTRVVPYDTILPASCVTAQSDGQDTFLALLSLVHIVLTKFEPLQKSEAKLTLGQDCTVLESEQTMRKTNTDMTVCF